MFRSRRSFKVAPGVRVNTGKRGVSSVSVAGVRLGTSSRGKRGGSRKPTKAEQQAKVWRMKPGLWYARFDTGDGDDLNLEVRGSELTYDRFIKMSTAATEKNAEAEARIFRQFIASWDMVKGEGGAKEPISAATLLKIGNGFYYGLTTELVNALSITKKPLDSVLRNANTGKPYPVRVSDKPFPATSGNYDPATREPTGDQSEQVSSVSPPQMNTRKAGKGRAKSIFTWIVVLLIAIILLAALF